MVRLPLNPGNWMVGLSLVCRVVFSIFMCFMSLWRKLRGMDILIINSCCCSHVYATVYGRNPAPVELGSLSHCLQGFIHPRWLFGISAHQQYVARKGAKNQGLLSKRWRSKFYVLRIFTSLPFTKKPPSMDWFWGAWNIEIPRFLLQVLNHEDRFLKYELVYRLCINMSIYTVHVFNRTNPFA